MDGRNVRRVRSGLAALAIAASPVAIGCGGESAQDVAADRGAIRDVARSVQESFAKGDVAGVCRRLTKAAQVHVGNAGHGLPEGCPKDLRTFGGWVEKGSFVPGRIVSTDVDGETATARMEFRGSRIDVPFAQEDGEWKLNALYGSRPAQLQEDNYP